MGMIKFKAPALPIPHKEYSEPQQEQLNRSLRVYFQQLDSTTPIESEYFKGRGDQLVIPYGEFFSTATQTAANTTTAYAVTFTNTDSSNQITLSNSSRLNVTYPGIYNIQFSLQFANNSTAPIDIDAWLRLNGTDVANSNSRFGLSQRKGAGDPFHILGSVSLIQRLAAGDYVEIFWRTSDVNGTIQYYAAGTSPTRPAIPSAIVAISFVSAVP